MSDLKCLVNSSSHTRFWHRDLKLIHHLTEEISVLCKIDDSRRCTEDLYAVLLKVRSKVKRCLTAELCDDAHWLFLVVNAENILKCKWLKVELI